MNELKKKDIRLVIAGLQVNVTVSCFVNSSIFFI